MRLCMFISSNPWLLWASKFATAKIECSFEMGKDPVRGNHIFC